MSSELFVNKILLPLLVWLLFCLPLLWIILVAHDKMRSQAESAPIPTDDFAAFYRDLRAKSKGVNFTRKEAASLYRWEQRWAEEGRKVTLHTNKEE